MSAKLKPTFMVRRCHVVSVTGPYGRIVGFLDQEPLLFLSSSSSVVFNEAEWTPFQAQYFSESLVVPGIEPGPLNL
jgi:hypothetical protein